MRLSIHSDALVGIVRVCLIGSALLVIGGTSRGAEAWAHKMFQATHHDFGTVSRNATADFAFEFLNSFDSDIRIVSVRSSCGCTKPVVAKSIIKPGERGQIIAQFNTRSFIGQKMAMITVVFDRPYYAEVQLTVSGHVRSDIVTDPGEIRFGDVESGQSREIVMRISYAGRPNWRITDVRGSSDHLEVRMDQGSRRGNTTTYTLKVRLKDTAPIGELQDELVVITDDQERDQFILPVSARIIAPVSITPQLVLLGDVKNVVEQRLIVKGSKPFSIVGVDCEDNRFTFKPMQGDRIVHIVPFEFKSDEHPGDFHSTVVVRTSLGQKISADCEVRGTVVR